MTAGAGDTRIVLRDQLGREEVVTASYYRPTGLLAPGTQEYAYTMGVQRENVGVESFDYGAPAALGLHRVGLSRSVTGTARAEASTDRASAGVGAGLGVGFGQVELSGAGSVAASGTPGIATALAWSVRGRRAGAAVYGRLQSSAYTVLGLAERDDRALVATGASVGVPFGSRVSASLSYAWSEYRDAGASHRASLSGGFQLPEDVQLGVFGTLLSTVGSDPATASLGLMAVRAIGKRTVASLGGETGSATTLAQASIASPLPAGTGLGYRVAGTASENGDADLVNGSVDGQAKVGRASASWTRTPSGAVGVAGVAGGVVFIGGRVLPSRPVDNAYALVRVPDQPGVTALLHNQPVARTDRRGDAVITGLLPYYGNTVGIAHEDVPLDHVVDASVQSIAPPERSGAIVVFQVERVRAVRGTITVDGASPTYGDLVVDGPTGEARSPVGAGGEFEVSGLSAGPWPARVHHPGGVCGFVLVVPATDASIVEVGPMRCEPREAP